MNEREADDDRIAQICAAARATWDPDRWNGTSLTELARAAGIPALADADFDIATARPLGPEPTEAS
jgi:hypothetical protein